MTSRSRLSRRLMAMLALAPVCFLGSMVATEAQVTLVALDRDPRVIPDARVLAGQPVEERRLADVGVADHDDSAGLAGSGHGRRRVPVRRRRGHGAAGAPGPMATTAGATASLAA